MNYHSKPKAISFSNPKLERILLGSLFTSNQILWQIEHAIRGETFTVQLHRDIFENLADMIRLGHNVTLPLLCGRLPDEGENEHGHTVSVRSYLSVCLGEAEDISGLEVYEELAELASLRHLKQMAEYVGKAIQKGDKRSEEIAADLEAAAVNIMRVASPSRPKKLADIAKTVVGKSRMARDEGSVPGLTTGLAALDELIGLIFPTDLLCILAASSDGKSAMAQQIGIHVSQTKPVLMIQMEMSDEQVAVREVAAASGISGYAIMEGKVNNFDFERVEEAQQKIASYNFWVHDTKRLTIRQIKGQALAMKRNGGLGLLIIDQLDKIKSERGHKSVFDKHEEVLTDLKDMAKDLGVPVLILAQRSRGGQRENEVPDVNDARVGPALEENCDTLIGLWRRENWLQKSKPSEDRDLAYGEWKQKFEDARDHAEVIALKRRSGSRFERRQLRWNGRITRFEDR